MFVEDELAIGRMRMRRISISFLVAATAFVACLAAMLGLASAARAEAQQAAGQLAALVRPNDVNSGSLLFPSKEPGFYVEAPRLKTDVTIDVSGPIARVKVTQRFQNPSQGWVEGTYVFPLPENSAVDALKMQIGERFIEGQIKPRQEAREIYEQAKAEGKKTALLEQQRPNIFTNQVANIGPGEEIIVQIEYQQTVHQSGGEFSLRFPMVVAPRYNPAPIVQTVEFNNGAGFATPRDPVENREKIEASVLDPSENAKINPVSLTVNLKAGFPLGDVNSSFHAVDIRQDSDQARTMSLKGDAVPADKDFELTWKAALGKTPSAGLFREVKDGKTYLLAFVTPPTAPDAAAAPTKREVVFVIDNSGSMSGQSIEQARQSLALAISRLSKDDRFNVIRFDDTMTDYFNGLVAASPDNREKAITYVRGLSADGGTEMLPALEDALRNQGPVASGALRQVVFLTDGAIGNEQQLFQEISANRGDARVFTVGIGSAPNTYFMTKAAEIGRGTFTAIGSTDQVASRMGELFAKLQNPAMTDIAATFEGTQAEDITPNPMPDLYSGEPVVLTAELPRDKPAGKLQIVGKTGDQPWRVEMDIAHAADGNGISKLWARRKIDDFEARAYQRQDPAALDKDIETVALAHHLVSRVTSLVAVDVTPSRPANEPLGAAKLPLNLPDGWDFGKVLGENAAPLGGGQDHGSITPTESAGPQQAAAVIRGRGASPEIANLMAAAPTAKAATMIAQKTSTVNLPQTATRADEQITRGLTMLLLALAAAIGLAVWRRRLKGVFTTGGRRNGL
ncbi:von Willebrand factor A domain-containing protein [Rhizobium phaseoli]|uniref:Marine proteobacterial sortase target protein n=2 Tax=Rhizobium TaxID=379 RepID=A0A192TBJ9_9HYPH|nr:MULTISPECIES: marine proteobacterial sortase target protein [Rhizobium]ACE92104.1 putative vault protein inter-alpha-trypsin domain [Rhizobium etli CIAT 652]MDH6646720.1 Ca-activated chloride channel family protein [Rhizobium esperanzae]ANL28948.1 von Willebrand factor A domain-containing protein [Rhizobium phaseoli]ANL41513.1 von Willebrand factor A domain-containing protein [Rhizobium phaseoli]ANL54218.1 von Willebrand factor A domain-containing protein [Rhizobium phaseoli]